ncbi:MAG: methyltransferase domain-containing protein [Planctomycetaceae bacterium]
MTSPYICPVAKTPLLETSDGLRRDDGAVAPFLPSSARPIPDFLSYCVNSASTRQAMVMYNQSSSPQVYRNFLEWLFLTFNEVETEFRKQLVSHLRLRSGSKVLVTGCGLGEDLWPIADQIGVEGHLWASDISAEMVLSAASEATARLDEPQQISFAVCDATLLPYADRFFDAAFHFGGINLFADVRQAVHEMNRVVKTGGRVVFGDEGIGPWLTNTEYGRIAVNNNRLWSAKAPIDLIPESAVDVHLTWVLGNCFYLIDFEVSDSGPEMNIDVIHKGHRGGSMRSRYFGQLEGVTEESRAFVIRDAKRRGISVHAWLEDAIRKQRNIEPPI